MKLIALVAILASTPACFLGPSAVHTGRHTCYTQPRTYCTPDGRCQQEIDHYEQEEPCPLNPVK